MYVRAATLSKDHAVRAVQDEIDALGFEIKHERALRDAQQEDSAFWLEFQHNIDRLTGQMLHWRQVAPKLKELDQDIRAAAGRARKARRRRDGGGALGAATMLGIVGLLMLIVLLMWPSPPGLLIALCVGTLVVAGGLLVLDARGRRERDLVASAAELDLTLLRKKWQEIVPDRKPWTQNAPVPVGGQGAFAEELED